MANTNEAIPTDATSILNINMSNISKLVSTNYLMWSLQVHALLDGYGLAGHPDGSKVAPSETITKDEVISLNPEFTIWMRQDRLIYSALIGALSTSLQPIVSRTTTAAQIWKKLASTYALPSRGHIKQLKTQIKNYTKGTKTIDEYLQGFTTKFDQLALLGKPMDHEDQVESILDGLPDEYKPVVDQIEGKDTPPSLTEIHERLLNHEAKVLSAAIVISTPLPVSANMVQHRNNQGNNRYTNYSRPRNHNNNSAWQPQQHNNSNSVRSPRPYLGKCQICNTQGHTARRCPQFQSMNHQHVPSSNTPYTQWQPRANLAASSPYTAENWLLDSGPHTT